MCLLLIAIKYHPNYKLVVAGNRDEFYHRPTAPAGFWDDAPDLLAGKDLVAGGTWLGVTRQGRIAAITNYRNPAVLKGNAPSRGKITQDFLLSNEGPYDYIQKLALTANTFNGFNLIVGQGDNFYWYSNVAQGLQHLSPGIYALSNHLLDTPWPKVVRARNALHQLLNKPNPLCAEDILSILMDPSIADDQELPDTGIGIEKERALSAIFIRSPGYGTRASYLLLIDFDNRVTFVERAFGEDPREPITHRFEFQIKS
jgi:uncharacterized protein with NRDE domain